MSFTSEAKQEVERLVRAGQKINAIKYVRDTFNVSLDNAKQLVEAVELEMNAGAPAYSTTTTAIEEATTTGSGLTSQAELHVKALLQSRKKIEAVKYVKEQLNTGLKESLTIVEAIEREINPDAVPSSVGSGCMKGALRVVAFIFGVVAFVLLAMAGIIYYINEEIVGQGEQVEGTVESLKYSGTSAAPIVVYEWHEKEYRYESTLYSTPPDYSKGERLPVFVNRDDPNEILIDRFTDRWLAIVVIAGVGAFFGIFCLAMVFISRRF